MHVRSATPAYSQIPSFLPVDLCLNLTCVCLLATTAVRSSTLVVICLLNTLLPPPAPSMNMVTHIDSKTRCFIEYFPRWDGLSSFLNHSTDSMPTRSLSLIPLRIGRFVERDREQEGWGGAPGTWEWWGRWWSWYSWPRFGQSCAVLWSERALNTFQTCRRFVCECLVYLLVSCALSLGTFSELSFGRWWWCALKVIALWRTIRDAEIQLSNAFAL